MRYIEVDFTNCRYYDEIHKVLKESFGLPEHYGANLDALFDSLRDVCGEKTLIHIKGISHLLNRKDSGEYMNEMLQVFEDIHKESPEMIFEVIS